MRSGVVAAAFALLLPAAATAQDFGPPPPLPGEEDSAFISGLPMTTGLRGSLAFSGDVHGTIPGSPPRGFEAKAQTGGGGSLYVGTRLPYNFKLEIEGLYRYLPLNKVDLGGPAIASDGHAHVAGPMINLLWEMPAMPGVPNTPVIGMGVGALYVASNPNDSIGTTYFRSTTWNLAYNFLTGAEFALNDTSRLSAMYSWLRVEDVRGKCGAFGVPTATCRPKLTTQSVDFGIEMDL